MTMGKNTLYVGGCSFSDYFENNKVCWGEILAEKLNMNYNHDAVLTSGSNDRIWRILTDKIIKKEITKDDKVFIQYTMPTRKEFASWKNPRGPKGHMFNTQDEDLYLLNFKDQCYTWHEEPVANKFLKQYEEYFSIDEYDMHIFNQRQYQFQTFLAYHNIDAYMLTLNAYVIWNDNHFLSAYFKKRLYSDNKFGYAEDERYAENDPNHLSESGHKKLANRLYTWMTDR